MKNTLVFLSWTFGFFGTFGLGYNASILFVWFFCDLFSIKIDTETYQMQSEFIVNYSSIFHTFTVLSVLCHLKSKKVNQPTTL